MSFASVLPSRPLWSPWPRCWILRTGKESIKDGIFSAWNLFPNTFSFYFLFSFSFSFFCFFAGCSNFSSPGELKTLKKCLALLQTENRVQVKHKSIITVGPKTVVLLFTKKQEIIVKAPRIFKILPVLTIMINTGNT